MTGTMCLRGLEGKKIKCAYSGQASWKTPNDFDEMILHIDCRWSGSGGRYKEVPQIVCCKDGKEVERMNYDSMHGVKWEDEA